MNSDEVKALEDRIVTRVTEQVLVALPNIFHHLLGSAALMKEMSNNFYKNNKDLVDHKDLVAKTIEKIQARNPQMRIDDILKKAAPQVRSHLKLKANISETPMSRAEIDQELGAL